MIIQCEKCGTRFRLPDDKMRPEGIKARCARCKQIFFATPPLSPDQESFGSFSQGTGKERFTPEQSEVSVSDEREPTKESLPSETGALERMWEEPQEKEETEPEQSPWAPSATTIDEEESDSSFEDGSFGEFSFGLSPEQEEEEFGELDQSDNKLEDEDFTFEPADEGLEEEVLRERDRELPEEDATVDPDPMFSFEETETSGKNDDLLDEVAPIEDKPKPETVEETDKEQFEVAAPQRKSPVASLMIFFLIVLIILTAVTGYLFWKQGPQAFERMLLELTGNKSEQIVSVGRIELNDYTASFLQNEQAGELFVIHGRARNLYEEPRSTIQIKGVIFNEAEKPVMQQTVFGGNALTEEQLTTLPYNKIEEAMTNQFGDHLSNLNLAPSDSIPFTIVFRNLPEGVAEFTVEVVDSRPATPTDTQK